MLDVIEVMLHSLLNLLDGLGLASPAVHLRPARDPRLHAMPGVVVPDRVLVEQTARLGGERMRPWAHDGHLATQDIDELRQLVEAGLAQEGTDPRHARIVPARELLGIIVPRMMIHGAELEDLDELVIEPITLLLEEDRPAAAQLDESGD